MRTVCVLGILLALAGCGIDSPVSRAVGARCESPADCDQQCLPPTSDDYPDGFCTVGCRSDRDCPGATRCADKEQGVCLFRCQVNLDCEFLGPGWRCKDVDALPEGEVSVCLGD